jgi:hypothetical protein
LFLQDNAAAHKAAIMQQKLTDLHFQFLKHSACSPDLAPSDCYLFPNLKKHLKGRKFSSIKKATLVADGWYSKAKVQGVELRHPEVHNVNDFMKHSSIQLYCWPA